MELQKFDFRDQEVRVIERDGDPWFVAKDVCDVLGIRVDAANRQLDDDEKGATTIGTLGGDQRVSVINEPGLYSLILRSRKERAREFKRWVTHEVLPTLRKTGGAYIEPGSKAASDDPLEMVERALLVAKEERAKREAAEAKVEFARPRIMSSVDSERRTGGQTISDLRHTPFDRGDHDAVARRRVSHQPVVV